ncbi:MAG: hypothetical protein COA78_20260 [Blastopirellula sp.]|nr:MAG: hypothetical protein COA78_20260 [Blastopirellula sp.]
MAIDPDLIAPMKAITDRLTAIEAQPTGNSGMALVHAQAEFFAALYAKVQLRTEVENVALFKSITASVGTL